MFDPYAIYAPRPVLVELGPKNGSLDKPAQSELGSLTNDHDECRSGSARYTSGPENGRVASHIRGIRRAHRRIVSRAAACCGPRGDRIKRGAIEFLVLAVGEAYSATPRTQLRTHDIKLACEGIGFLESDLSVFEDHTALIFELFAYDEVKIEVGHTNRLPISIRKQIYHRAIGSPIEWTYSSLIVFVCCISAFKETLRTKVGLACS